MNACLAIKSICFVGIAISFIVLLSIGKVSADVYVTKDKDGVMTFTNVPCTEEQMKQGCKYVLPDRQWAWRKDINYDGKVTISDIPGWFQWLFYYPGDLLVYGMLKDKKSAEFFELTPASYGGIWSLLVSLVAWLVVAAVIVDVCEEFAGYVNKWKQRLNHQPDWMLPPSSSPASEERLTIAEVAAREIKTTVPTLWYRLGRWLRAKARALRKN